MSCVPWLKKLKAAMSRTRYAKRGQCSRSARRSSPGRAASFFQVGDSGTFARRYSTSAAGRAPTTNMPRHPSTEKKSPKRIEASRYPSGYPCWRIPEIAPRLATGADSSASAAPTPHSPPIATP